MVGETNENGQYAHGGPKKITAGRGNLRITVLVF